MTAPDPTILAAAIKCAEEDLQTFRGIDDPEIKKLVEFSEVILVAAKAYQPMREALEKTARQFEFYAREHAQKADRALSAGKLDEATTSIAKGKANAEFAAMCRAALNPAGPA